MKKYIFFIFLLLFIKYIYSQDLFGYQIIPVSNNYFNLSNNFNSSYLYQSNILYLPQNYYLAFPVSLNQSEYLYIYYNLNYNINLYIMNSTDYNNFLNGNISYINSFSSSNLYDYIYLNPGNYYIVFYNNNSNIVNGFYYIYQNQNQGYPIFLPYGIADYGIAILNNSIYTYSYNTNEYIGEININNLQLNNLYCNTDSISFQLNNILFVNTNNGPEYFWLQNVLQINTSSNQYFFGDNLWNFSSSNSYLSNSSISGDGYIENYNGNNLYGYLYNQTYNLQYPVNIYLITKVQNNLYPIIMFGYSINGQNIIWYDNVTLNIQSSDSYIIVSPQDTPGGYLEDSGLIIGGPGNGSCSYINNINTNLSLYFLYNYNNIYLLSPIEYFFNYGLDTAETSSNIYPVQNGYYLSYQNGQPFLSFFQYQTSSNYYNVTILYPNGTELYNIYPANYDLNITFPEYINLTNYSIENLSYISINGQKYYNNTLNIVLSSNITIIPNYILEYLLYINSSYNYSINGNQYYGKNYFWIPYDNQIYIEFNNITYLNNYTRYFLYDIYINNISYNNNYLLLNITNYTEIYPNYILQYFVNISSPFQFSINNTYYYNFNNWEENSTEINISWNRINNINQEERYYCNITNDQILITNPVNLYLSNFCNLQYLINISTILPLNISINNQIYRINGTYLNYINNNTQIYIEPVKYTFSSFFKYTIYYYQGEVYTINSPETINIIFNKRSGYNYINIGIVGAIIAVIIIFILW